MSQKKIAMLENLVASPRLDILLVIASALDIIIEMNIRNRTEKEQIFYNSSWVENG